MNKNCISCNQDKNIELFASYYDKRTDKTRIRNECKECRSIRESLRNRENQEKRIHITKKWRDTNKDKIRDYERERHNQKRREDLQFRLKTDIVSHTRHFINGERKSLDFIGCSIEELQTWFEYLFYDNMTWMVKDWTVDHVIPLSFFDLTDSKQMKLACHWTNIRPTKNIDNRSKNDKIDKELILSHIEKTKQFLSNNNSYQTSTETCWWQRVELWYGKNAQDEKDFLNLLKWAIRSEDPKPL